MEQTLRGQDATKAELLQADQAAFRPLPAAPFEACRKIPIASNSLSLVRFCCNDYSLPVEYAPRIVVAEGFVDRVEICRLAACPGTTADRQTAHRESGGYLAAGPPTGGDDGNSLNPHPPSAPPAEPLVPARGCRRQTPAGRVPVACGASSPVKGTRRPREGRSCFWRVSVASSTAALSRATLHTTPACTGTRQECARIALRAQPFRCTPKGRSSFWRVCGAVSFAISAAFMPCPRSVPWRSVPKKPATLPAAAPTGQPGRPSQPAFCQLCQSVGRLPSRQESQGQPRPARLPRFLAGVIAA